MRGVFRMVGTVVGLGALAMACMKVPYTGRVQYNLIPHALMDSVGVSAYRSTLQQADVQKQGPNVRVLNTVGRRISAAAGKPSYDWEYALIRDPEAVNAWCLPGGKIAFYTGILPALKNEAGMAFVMGHEVGHAVANHGGERLSQQLTLVGGLVGINAFLTGNSTLKPEERALVMGAIGLGAELGVMLPFSRAHESEADVIGMMYMAKAGYPPAESIAVWQRMKEITGPGLPGFLSTHPPHRKRQENLRQWLPQARKRYLRNKLSRDTRVPLWEPVPAAQSTPPRQ